MQENKRRDFSESHQTHSKLSDSNQEKFPLSRVQSFQYNHKIIGLLVDLASASLTFPDIVKVLHREHLKLYQLTIIRFILN